RAEPLGRRVDGRRPLDREAPDVVADRTCHLRDNPRLVSDLDGVSDLIGAVGQPDFYRCLFHQQYLVERHGELPPCESSWLGYNGSCAYGDTAPAAPDPGGVVTARASRRCCCTKAIARLPSPTAEATRLTGPERTSPQAKMAGTLV